MKRHVILSVCLLTSFIPHTVFSAEQATTKETAKEATPKPAGTKRTKSKPMSLDEFKQTVTQAAQTKKVTDTDITDNTKDLPVQLVAVTGTENVITEPTVQQVITQQPAALRASENENTAIAAASNVDAAALVELKEVVVQKNTDTKEEIAPEQENNNAITALLVPTAAEPVATKEETPEAVSNVTATVAVAAAASEEKKVSQFETTINAARSSLDLIIKSNKSEDEKTNELQLLKSTQEKIIDDITIRLANQTTKATEQKTKIAQIARDIKLTSNQIKEIRTAEPKRYRSNQNYKALTAKLSDLQKAEITADSALLSISGVAQKTYNKLRKVVDLRNTIAERRSEVKGGKRVSSLAKALFWKTVTLGTGDTTGCDSDDKINLPEFNAELFPQVLQQKEISFFNNTPQSMLSKKEEPIDASEEEQIAQIKTELKEELMHLNKELDQDQLKRKIELRKARNLEIREKAKKEQQKDPMERTADLESRSSKNLAIRTKQAEVKKTVQKMLVKNRLNFKK